MAAYCSGGPCADSLESDFCVGRCIWISLNGHPSCVGDFVGDHPILAGWSDGSLFLFDSCLAVEIEVMA